MKAGRILETALYAQDLAAAETFYTNVMGLTVHQKLPGRHVFFRSGENMFLVFNPDTTEKEPHPHGCRGRGHVAWAVRDEAELDQWKAWLESKGVAVRVHTWDARSRSLYFSDPAQNSLELLTPRIWGLA